MCVCVRMRMSVRVCVMYMPAIDAVDLLNAESKHVPQGTGRET